MSTIALQRPNFSSRWRYGTGASPRWTISCRVSTASKAKDCVGESKRLTLGEIDKNSPSKIIIDRSVEITATEFGKFTAREAQLYEEYWTAAWLRAKSLWEERESERYADNNIRNFAQQEFNAMARRYNANLGEKCKCVVMVKKGDMEVKQTILQSDDVVGTLDLSIKHFSNGETFPGERLKHPLFCLIERKPSICYAYIANLCVAKIARRKGVARSMLEFAISTAKADGKLSRNVQKRCLYMSTNIINRLVTYIRRSAFRLLKQRECRPWNKRICYALMFQATWFLFNKGLFSCYKRVRCIGDQPEHCSGEDEQNDDIQDPKMGISKIQTRCFSSSNDRGSYWGHSPT